MHFIDDIVKRIPFVENKKIISNKHHQIHFPFYIFSSSSFTLSCNCWTILFVFCNCVYKLVMLPDAAAAVDTSTANEFSFFSISVSWFSWDDEPFVFIPLT